MCSSYHGPSRSPGGRPAAASVAATNELYIVSLSSSAGAGRSDASRIAATVVLPAPGGPATTHAVGAMARGYLWPNASRHGMIDSVDGRVRDANGAGERHRHLLRAAGRGPAAGADPVSGRRPGVLRVPGRRIRQALHLLLR